MIMDQRNPLHTDAVEAVECLHHWLSSGLVDNIVKMLEWIVALIDEI